MLITDPSNLKRFAAPHRIWQGIPGIVRTKGNRTFVSFYSGDTKETYGNFAAVVMAEGDTPFGEPILVAEKSGKFRCFDPVLWIDPLERLWFIWNVMPGEEVYATICENPDAETLVWQKEFCVGRGIMMNKPLVLSTGEWLFPIALWSTEFYYDMRKSALTSEDIPASYVYKTSDNGKTFLRLGGADIRNRSFDEHMVVEMENGVLRMLVRLKKGIGESYSYDRGKTWSRGQVTDLGSPSSRFFFGKLRSGRILLINHHQFHGRNNLTAFLSEDDGKTFPYTLLLDERANVSYPDVMEHEDGFLDLVYDRERGCFKSSLSEVYSDAREILHARITEADILNGSICTKGSFLKRTVSKLGTLAEEHGDPFSTPTISDREFARLLLEGTEQDLIGKIFERYPLDCLHADRFDFQKLDELIARFHAEDGRDEALLIRIIEQMRTASCQKAEISPVVESIKVYIEEHLSESLPIQALAEQMKISKYYLSHLFKSVTGISIIDYRNELRLTRAKLLLIRTQQSISQIAQDLGFCSAAYFTELFTKSERISPREFRKYHQV